VNQGGEPAHDDYGLPPVDIEIPDDARELDRDVQAYRRELRALRRHERSDRWRAPLRRSGMIVPVMAGCLILAMVAGMVLTMFSANPYFSGLAGQRLPSPGLRNAAPSAGQASASSAPRSARVNTPGGPGTAQAARLPRGNISVAGRPVALRRLADRVLVIVPASCGCAAAISGLVRVARQAKVKVYLVEMQGVQLSKPVLAAAKGTAQVASDAGNLLSRYYKAAGPVVVLVDAHSHARVAALNPDLHFEQELRALQAAH
jgi:hypothetical protein